MRMGAPRTDWHVPGMCAGVELSYLPYILAVHELLADTRLLTMVTMAIPIYKVEVERFEEACMLVYERLWG